MSDSDMALTWIKGFTGISKYKIGKEALEFIGKH
jgi:hypothetical protein